MSCLSFALFLPLVSTAFGATTVTDSAALRAAVYAAKPGATILLAPGKYAGGLHFQGVNGTAAAPITLRAADAARPPVFEGGQTAMQFSDCNYIVISGVVVRDFTANGINIDDGGSYDTPSRGMVVENVTVERTGPRGNHDALKMSGVRDFEVRRSTFRGWGGSAIDMVGCHRGVVTSCTFEGLAGHDQNTGIQLKGGTADVVVRESHFRNAGERAINLGGHTGLEFFRPRPEGFEATRIEITQNRFEGSRAVVAFVNARGGRVHRNTIHLPQRWVLRILQENTAPGFTPCADGVFEHNHVTLDKRVQTVVNVGDGTAPNTFVFRGNSWLSEGVPIKPSLPVAEIAGTNIR